MILTLPARPATSGQKLPGCSPRGTNPRGRWSVTRPARLTATSKSPRAISTARTRWMRPCAASAPSCSSARPCQAQEIAVIDNAVRQGATHVIKVTGKASTAVR